MKCLSSAQKKQRQLTNKLIQAKNEKIVRDEYNKNAQTQAQEDMKQVISMVLFTYFKLQNKTVEECQQFYRDMTSVTMLMQTGILGKEFDVTDTIKFCKEVLNIDLDEIKADVKWEEKI